MCVRVSVRLSNVWKEIEVKEFGGMKRGRKRKKRLWMKAEKRGHETYTVWYSVQEMW